MKQIGEKVFVKKIKKNAVITEVLGPGRYRLTVGSLSLQAKEEELAEPGPEPKASPTPTSKQIRRVRNRSVDLHGLSVHDALRRVEAEVNRAVLDHVDELQLMHGKGTGKLLIEIHNYLGTLSVVRSFSLDPANAGVTRVYTG